MRKAGGGGLLLAGIFLVFMGYLIKSNLLESLLDVLGVVVIILGAIMGIIGLIGMFSGGGNKRGYSDF